MTEDSGRDSPAPHHKPVGTTPNRTTATGVGGSETLLIYTLIQTWAPVFLSEKWRGGLDVTVSGSKI